MREIDRARVRQPADHLLRDERLDLPGLELPHEALQELARLVAADALDFDRHQQVAVTLGDGQVHANVTRDELLELIPYRCHQWRVRAQVLRPQHGVLTGGGAKLGLSLLAPAAHHGPAERARAGRQVHARKQPVHLVHDPPFKCHVSSPVGDHHRRQWTRHSKVSHARAGGQAIALRKAFDELPPGGLYFFPGVDARLQRRQREIDLHGDPRHVADLDDRAAKRVLHVREARREGSVERPDERRFDARGGEAARVLPSVAVRDRFHLASPGMWPVCRAAICMPISAAGLGPWSPAL
jgi:hypothetical protein